jgi:hypothetical protein
MNLLLQFLLDPKLPLWKFCFMVSAVAAVPSAAIYSVVNASLQAAGVDLTHLEPPVRTGSMREWFGAVLFAPFVETLLLAAVLSLLHKLSDRKVFIAVASGLLWGALHATFGVLWFFGTTWSFFVLSCAYLGWHGRSPRKAFAAAWFPHVLVNLSAMTIISVTNAA